MEVHDHGPCSLTSMRKQVFVTWECAMSFTVYSPYRAPVAPVGVPGVAPCTVETTETPSVQQDPSSSPRHSEPPKSFLAKSCAKRKESSSLSASAATMSVLKAKKSRECPRIQSTPSPHHQSLEDERHLPPEAMLFSRFRRHRQETRGLLPFLLPVLCLLG
jgi:hypothetical protein